VGLHAPLHQHETGDREASRDHHHRDEEPRTQSHARQ
jgi:hypothetical protein